jgi:molybdopterin synthase sulfur carrier subunit
MKLLVKLLRPFSEIVGKKELELEFNGGTISGLLELMVDRYPKLKDEFYRTEEGVSEYVCIFVNDKPISALNGVDTRLKDGDEVLFFIPVSGG